MTIARPLSIAILAHSTNPRGGVVHALALGDALTRLGHDAVVHAPDAKQAGFFRPTLCRTLAVPASPAGPSLRELVETRIADYVRHFEDSANRRFDVFHAQDGISGNALATLKARGLIGGFARTVHHVDSFDDAHVAALQTRSIVAADRFFTVSRLWQEGLARDFGLETTIVGNGVDRDMFSADLDGREAGLRVRLDLGPGPLFLAIGGIEARKNTLNILRAFRIAAAAHPTAQLIIAGGISLLDHSAYQAAFMTEMAGLGEAASRVVFAGGMAQADLPALYRLADALVFPSVKEGFGLVALESIACGTPVVISAIAPFTEHFGEDDVVWCDPLDPGSIAAAMERVLHPAIREALASRREAALAAHSWDATARAHLAGYELLREVEHA